MAASENTRVTVNLVPRAVKALEAESKDSGMNKTDVINRALAVYRYFQEETRAGKELLLRSGEKVESIKIV
jgi:hypothetical protein